MKYRNKEVISDSEAKRFARNLCKKKGKFPSLDDALAFVLLVYARPYCTTRSRTVANAGPTIIPLWICPALMARSCSSIITLASHHNTKMPDRDRGCSTVALTASAPRALTPMHATSTAR
jgi:hypothetical protein